MKPQKIILVRHGESIGNVSSAVYAHTPDWKLPLTDKGHEQAHIAATEIRDLVRYPKLDWSYYTPSVIYASPWIRARETAAHIRTLVPHKKYYEDPRLREQEWGNYQTLSALKRIHRERDDFGTFFYRMTDGESGADVYDRVSTFLETLYRDFEKDDYPGNAIIVTHGLTLRIFLMRWYHWTVEEYEALKNPKNCAVVVMDLDRSTDRYVLKTELAKRVAKVCPTSSSV